MTELNVETVLEEPEGIGTYDGDPGRDYPLDRVSHQE